MGIDLGIPETIAAISESAAAASPYLTAASAVVSTVGALSSAAATARSAKYNAGLAAENAQIANQNATMAGAAGEQQAALAEQKTRATVGAIKAGQAGSGVDVNTGSAVDVQSSAAALGETDAINIRANAARQAYGYQTQATGYTAQQQLDKATADNAGVAGDITAGATLLGGFGQAGSKYSKYLMNGGSGLLVPPS